MPVQIMERARLMTLIAISGILHQTIACSEEGSPFTLIQNSGTIQSPGFPNYYNANERCSWKLSPARQPTLRELLIITLELETNVGIPDENDLCSSAKNFVTIGNLKGCNKEGPICLAYMLSSAVDFRCHNIINRYFPSCQSLLHRVWPFEVGFQTVEADHMKGFQVNYTFIDCKTFTPPTAATATTTTTTTAATTVSTSEKTAALTETKGDATGTEAENEVASSEDESTTEKVSTTTTTTIITKTTLRQTSDSQSQRPTTRSTMSTTTTRSTEILKDSNSNQHHQSSSQPNPTLIAVFVVLCVILITCLAVCFFRRKIKEFFKTDKSTKPHSNNNTIEYAGCVLDMEKAHALKMSQETPTNLPKEEENTSALVTIAYDNKNPSSNFQYNRLQSSTSDAGTQNTVPDKADG